MKIRVALAAVCAVGLIYVGTAFAAYQTYYVGNSSGTCGTAPWNGYSNGIGHFTIENAERNCLSGCLDVWLANGAGGQISGTFQGTTPDRYIGGSDRSRGGVGDVAFLEVPRDAPGLSLARA